MYGTLLQKVNSPQDIKDLDIHQLKLLSEEIRSYIISTIEMTGGHLGANLGVVELTLALHSELNSPKDRIIWDVGHQCYPHKLITGRKDQFFFFSSRRRHTRSLRDWSSDVCSSDLTLGSRPIA